jgi:hypothetical protein
MGPLPIPTLVYLLVLSGSLYLSKDFLQVPEAGKEVKSGV